MSGNRLLVAVLAGLALLASPAAAQEKPEKIRELLRRYHEAGQFNGSALISEQGRVIYRGSFGLANYEWNIPNTPETKFRLGSITKAFTAMLVLQLVEQGELRLDDKVIQYLPEFKKTGGRITIDQLLTHTSGLPDYNNLPDEFRMVQSGLLSPAEIIHRIAEYDLLFEPGTKFGYSNDGYRVLGAIIEKVTSKSYEQVLRENILASAGMENTGYSSRTAVLPKRAAGYMKRLAGLETAAFYEPSPASGMYSTVDDLYRWNQALDGEKLLQPNHKALVWSISPYGNAYGWHVSKVKVGEKREKLKQMSEGAVFGYFARFVRLPEDNHLIILLTNVRASTNYLPDVEQGVISILYGEPYKAPQRSIAETMLATFRQAGIGAALQQYRELKPQQPESYNFAENELNMLGYEFLRVKKLKEAIEVFKLNTETYPRSANAYDSLGEAYMAAGDDQNAIANYQKSVELDHKNTNGIQMLKRLRSKP